MNIQSDHMDSSFPPSEWREEERSFAEEEVEEKRLMQKAHQEAQDLANMTREFSFGLLEDNKRISEIMGRRVEQLTITVNYMKDALPIALVQNEYGDPVLAAMPPDNSSILDTSVTFPKRDVAVFAKEDLKRKAMLARRESEGVEGFPARTQWDEVAKYILTKLPYTIEAARLLDLYNTLEDQKRRLIDAGRVLESKASAFAENKLKVDHPELYRELKAVTEDFNSTNTLVYFSRQKGDTG